MAIRGRALRSQPNHSGFERYNNVQVSLTIKMLRYQRYTRRHRLGFAVMPLKISLFIARLQRHARRWLEGWRIKYERGEEVCKESKRTRAWYNDEEHALKEGILYNDKYVPFANYIITCLQTYSSTCVLAVWWRDRKDMSNWVELSLRLAFKE